MEQYLEVIGNPMALTHKPGKHGAKIEVCVKVIFTEEISDKILSSVAIHLSEVTEMSATLIIKEWQCVVSKSVSTFSTQ